MLGTTIRVLPIWAKVASFAAALVLLPAMASAEMAETSVPRETWSFAGMTGHFDKAQLQRGYRVYKEVCANCHSLRLIKYRNLAEPGGPGFTEGQVNTLIKDVEFEDAVDANGLPAKRAAMLADAVKGPFANEAAARAANNGAVPPDLSLMARARNAPLNVPLYLAPFQWLSEIARGYQEGGPDYIHSLLTSYHDKAPPYLMNAQGRLAPVPEAQAVKDSLRCVSITAAEGEGKKDECTQLAEGLYYNTTYPGHQIHMPPPLAADGQVEYTDGTRPVVDQYARDVSAFLAWTADPTLEERKETGLKMMIYLLILSVLLWFAKRQIWARLH